MGHKDFNLDFAGSTYPVFVVETSSRAQEVLSRLCQKKSVIACDLETGALPEWKDIGRAALSPFLAKPRLLQVFTGTGCVVFDLWKTGPLDLSALFRARPSVFHNVTFDYKMLARHHEVRAPDMHCTCIMARCVFHAIYAEDVGADLGNVCKTILGEDMNKRAGASDWSVPELTFEQIQYAAMDVVVLMRLYEKLSEYIDKLGLRRVYELYRRAQIVISDMELQGIEINSDAHRINVIRWREELKDAQDAVTEMTGIPRITDKELSEWLEKNLPDNIRDIWPVTEKAGKLATDAHTFADFSYLPIVKPFSKFQRLKKLTTSFGMNLLAMRNPATGKLHPTYRVAGARTGRLSCTEPNIQQSPRTPDFRSIFIPSPGKTMVVGDYGQVEVRCIAELSGDTKMLKAYQEGLDIYRYTAANLNSKPMDKVTKEERQASKALVLGLNYGLGAKKFSHYARKGYGVEVAQGEAEALVGAYRELYSGLRSWQMRQVDICPMRKFTAYSAMGKSRKMTEDNYYGACMNHPVQGSCAEIMLLALLYSAKAFEGTSAKLLASVHDEIVLECDPVDVEWAEKTLADSMTKAYLEILPSGRTVRNLVKPTHGINWAEAKHD